MQHDSVDDTTVLLRHRRPCEMPLLRIDGFDLRLRLSPAGKETFSIGVFIQADLTANLEKLAVELFDLAAKFLYFSVGGVANHADCMFTELCN
jgi:hypothetical protein